MTVTRLVAISDFCTRVPPLPSADPVQNPGKASRRSGRAVTVRGGYLERLPLAALHAGLVETAEVWSFAGTDEDTCGLTKSPYGIDLRQFRAEGHGAPYGSRQMEAHLHLHGAPEILCVWGLGVTEEILDLCRDSILIYNSLDVDALRIPPQISRHFDIFLCGSAAQIVEVRCRHPEALTSILPIGPEFASPETFCPTGAEKSVDVIYVAAAQAYKRHDILFDALAASPGKISALCVMGYGEDAAQLRDRAQDRRLNVEFVGPPGVTHDEVNRLMNRARIGVVCGENDGAPAILTEYMLAGLPVLANEALRCGLQYIRPDTGMTAPAHGFAAAIGDMLATLEKFDPRPVVLKNWSWDHSVNRLADLVQTARLRRGTLVPRRLGRS